MTVSDQLMFSVFKYYKSKYKQKANSIAVIYITVLESSVVLFLGVLSARFFRQMHVNTMPSDNAWILFGLTVVFLYFKNWLKYSGKKRRVLNANQTKYKTKTYNIFVLWLLPLVIVMFSFAILRA